MSFISRAINGLGGFNNLINAAFNLAIPHHSAKDYGIAQCIKGFVPGVVALGILSDCNPNDVIDVSGHPVVVKDLTKLVEGSKASLINNNGELSFCTVNDVDPRAALRTNNFQAALRLSDELKAQS